MGGRMGELLEVEHRVLLEEGEHRMRSEIRISLLLEVVRLLLGNLPPRLDHLRSVLCLHLRSHWDQEIPEHRILHQHLVLTPQHSATLHPPQRLDNPNRRSAAQPPPDSVNPPPPSPPNHPSSAPHLFHLPRQCPPPSTPINQPLAN